MTLGDLVAKVQEKTGLNTANSSKAVITVFDAVLEAIDSADDKIVIPRLGIFIKRKMAESPEPRIVFRRLKAKIAKK